MHRRADESETWSQAELSWRWTGFLVNETFSVILIKICKYVIKEAINISRYPLVRWEASDCISSRGNDKYRWRRSRSIKLQISAKVFSLFRLIRDRRKQEIINETRRSLWCHDGAINEETSARLTEYFVISCSLASYIAKQITHMGAPNHFI